MDNSKFQKEKTCMITLNTKVSKRQLDIARRKERKIQTQMTTPLVISKILTNALKDADKMVNAQLSFSTTNLLCATITLQ
jgi:hypothetical protein